MKVSQGYPMHPGRILIVVVCCLVWMAGIPPGPLARANAVTAAITVNTTLDELNNDGDCSLREAVRAANSDAPMDACLAGSGADVILLPAGTYILTIEGINEDAAQSGDLDITSSLTIVGVSTRDTTINGNHTDRIFEVIGSTTFSVRRMTLRNGFIPSGGMYGGGAILNNLGGVLNLYLVDLRENVTAKNGGAIDNIGSARLNFITLDCNLSSPAGFGGAIYNPGSLVVENSIFSYNTAYNESAIDYGGGLFNDHIVTLQNVTFSHNSAEWGGGLFNQGDEANLYSVTFTGNTSAIHNQGSLRIKNSIAANSTTGLNCDGIGTISTQGFNIDSGDTCNFEIDNTNPLLGGLADNQGPTFTHALLMGSPAIDHGDPSDCPDTDQRGGIRPVDGDSNGSWVCDIGAYEYLASLPTLIYLPILGK